MPQKSDDANVIILDQSKNDENKSTTQENSPPTTHEQKHITSLLQKQHDGKKLTENNNYSYADSLFEPHTFGYPSFFEDHFKGAGHQPYFPNLMLQMTDTNDNCCHFDKLFGTDFQCIDDFFVPEENLFC